MDLAYILYFILAALIWIVIKIIIEWAHGGSEDQPDAPDEGYLWGKNLLKNNCGQNKLNYWNKLVNGGDGWIVQSVPEGADPLPKTANGKKILDFGKNTSCFVTSGELCLKEQVVDLLEQGFSAEDLDKQPLIKISEWYACHCEYTGDYLIEVTILNENEENMKSFLFKEDFSNLPKGKWQQITHTFSDYGTGARYVKFNHAGKAELQFPGHLGTKISGSVVKLESLNSPKK